jgi:hypothetical protein
MSNYPEGSMRGSGIYQQEIEATRECESEVCEGLTRQGMIIVDDFGNAVWVCDECGAEVEVEDDRDPDDGRGDW